MTTPPDTTRVQIQTWPCYAYLQVECTQSDGELNVQVKIPEEGQYALKVFCRDAGSNEFDEACIYLIRQREKSRLPEVKQSTK